MMMTGAQAMVKCLEAEGVTTIFGYPGAAICPFYDSLVDSSIRHILTRNEQNAGHAASGYARVTGRPAVCVATSGPGATNLFTAIATAYMDSIPLVAITGQVSSELLGRDVFQEVDTTGAAEPFTKYSYLVKDAAEIPRVFKEAFYIASTGRKGPVLIDMPVDIQRELLDFSYPHMVNIRGYKPQFKGHPMQVKRVAAAIRAAKRPLLCLGGGVFAANAQKAVRKLCEQCRLPAVTTMMGIGALPSGHPLYFGMLGQSGDGLANRAVEESDLLIIIGARVGDRAIQSPRALESMTTVVHIDIDAAEIGKNLGTTIPLVGDAALVVEQLVEQNPMGEWDKWIGWLDGQREPFPAHPAAGAGYINPNAFIRLLSERLEKDVLYVSDVGENQIWSAKNHIVREGRFLTTGGMGTMGYALPAAIGAKLAAPGRQVVAVCGDGAFQMSMMELATMNQHGVPVKLVVMRNGALGLVREIQQNQYRGREIAVDLTGSPSIAGIAAAYGIPSMQVSDMQDAPAALDAFLEGPESFVLECVVDPKEGT
ncbi:biosynthetic-type acetolactate synthase large subunit [Anaerotruncus sp. AF02-27]|uniref:biosynthetic-type acetolactate synthase large subunit n=1 Tax=Anaerotruncus TaxID=244127 RepID=UPI000E525FA9|nr:MULTISPECIES: biosynthetic-type acetolactate synthase large subunit [Anaerotruncus]RGX56416.1 biosynthetic-type acetolactate synthase large subunit [Anaerotruncus sp. AF02-27]